MHARDVRVSMCARPIKGLVEHVVFVVTPSSRRFNPINRSRFSMLKTIFLFSS